MLACTASWGRRASCFRASFAAWSTSIGVSLSTTVPSSFRFSLLTNLVDFFCNHYTDATMFADIARRGLSHPNAIAYVKRGITARSDTVEVPGWGLVLLYLSFWVAALSIYLVRRATALPE
jgi:hypothetical protein